MTGSSRHIGPLLLLLGLCACSLDDRVLLPAVAGAAGLGQAQGGSGSSAGSADEAGAAGAEDSPRGGAGNGQGGTGNGQAGGSGLVEGCADLDTDGVADCTLTLLNTPSFSSNVDDWTAVGDAELSWDEKNALDDLPSGSAKLSGRATFVKATQCVPVEGQKLLIAYANAFVEAEEEVEGARALLEVSYFASEDCSGVFDGFFETPPSSELNGWTTIHAGSVSMTTTRSVLVTLIGARAGAGTTQCAYFDNVMLKAQEL